MLFTEQKILDHGVEIELNPVIRVAASWAKSRLALSAAIILGVAIPTAVIMLLGWFFPDVLSFALGIRFCLFLFQQQSRYHSGKS